jgi:hypothetical protein
MVNSDRDVLEGVNEIEVKRLLCHCMIRVNEVQ